MFSFSTMILECCFASIFVASFVETNDALALPLFTHSFLSLSLSLKMLSLKSEYSRWEWWVYIYRVKSTRKQQRLHQTNETTTEEKFLNFFWNQNSLPRFSLSRLLCFLKFFLFAVLFHLVPTLLTHFCSCLQLSKKNAGVREKEPIGFFASHKL